MATIVCYGDSNTWGTDPATYRRFPKHVRWTGVLARELGPDCDVIAEGMRSRTTDADGQSDDPYNGLRHLLPALECHSPVDLLVLLLGTNDLQARFGRSASDAAAGAVRLVRFAQSTALGPGDAPPAVLLLAPTPIEEVGWLGEEFHGAAAKSRYFAEAYRRAAEELGCAFLDTGAVWTPSPIDGVHFEALEHEKMGRAVAAAVKQVLNFPSPAGEGSEG